MKFALVILVFIALLVQSFSRSLVVADYLVNLDAYKKACINKAKPMLHCNGKCQMLKKMKKQEGQNNANLPAQKFNLEEQVLSSAAYFPSLYLMDTEVLRLYPDFKSAFSSAFTGSVFHPPTV